MTMEHIVHSIPPTYDERSRVLVLGSLPSPKSREYGFNYGHPRNRFWDVMARLADEPIPSTVERKRDFCLRHHIALWDVVAECDIEGASDASIRNARANDLARIVEAAPIEAVFCTGAKAHELYKRLGCEQACGLPAIKLPSTSPANAATSFEALVEAYAQVFEHTHEAGPSMLSVAEVRDLEARIADASASLAELMDRAGTAVAHRVAQIAREAKTKFQVSKPAITILCGNGNNGGDGWVAAELLAKEGFDVSVVCAKGPEDVRAQPAHDAAVRAYAVLARTDATVLVCPDDTALESLMDRAQVVVDSIFGIGLQGAVKEPFASWIRIANQTRANHMTIAVDIPSGVNANDGSSIDPLIADETISMIVAKPGLTAPECGKVRIAPVVYSEPFLG